MLLTKSYPLVQGSFDLLALHRLDPSRYPFLLESVTRSPLSRYSLLFAFPQSQLVIEDASQPDFLDQLDQHITSNAHKDTDNTLPFSGGWFVCLNYELAEQIEPILDLPKHRLGLPLAVAVRIPAAVIIDHEQAQLVVVTEADRQDIFEQLLQDVEHVWQQRVATKDTSAINLDLQEEAAIDYTQGVETIKHYITAGDVFQVNFSREWQGHVDEKVSPADLYAQLRIKNPAPFAALCDFGDWSIISSSPERLVKVQNGQVDTRPIAGTRPRNAQQQQDQALLEELIAHPKERAEHIMLIDLERNDLGRICKPGTVEVDELMVLESYEHVHHIVSNVRGQLQENVSAGQVIKAVFPGGTITGCPKVRCMEIIAELEKTGRGAYTGSVGYINHNGDMDFNILIRSLLKHGDDISFRTGAGIVFDSVPVSELQETRHKAKGMLRVFDESYCS